MLPTHKYPQNPVAQFCAVVDLKFFNEQQFEKTQCAFLNCHKQIYKNKPTPPLPIHNPRYHEKGFAR